MKLRYAIKSVKENCENPKQSSAIDADPPLLSRPVKTTVGKVLAVLADECVDGVFELDFVDEE